MSQDNVDISAMRADDIAQLISSVIDKISEKASAVAGKDGVRLLYPNGIQDIYVKLTSTPPALEIEVSGAAEMHRTRIVGSEVDVRPLGLARPMVFHNHCDSSAALEVLDGTEPGKFDIGAREKTLIYLDDPGKKHYPR